MFKYTYLTNGRINGATNFAENLINSLYSSDFCNSFYTEEREKDNKLVYSVNVAGHNKSNIKIKSNKNKINIISTKGQEEKELGFIAIPSGFDSKLTGAKIEDGILTLFIPRKEDYEPLEIKIE